MFEKGLLATVIDRKFNKNQDLIVEKDGIQTLPLYTSHPPVGVERQVDEAGNPTSHIVEFSVDDYITRGISRPDHVRAVIEADGVPRLSEDHLRSMGHAAGDTLPRIRQWRLAAKILLGNVTDYKQ